MNRCPEAKVSHVRLNVELAWKWSFNISCVMVYTGHCMICNEITTLYALSFPFPAFISFLLFLQILFLSHPLLSAGVHIPLLISSPSTIPLYVSLVIFSADWDDTDTLFHFLFSLTCLCFFSSSILLFISFFRDHWLSSGGQVTPLFNSVGNNILMCLQFPSFPCAISLFLFSFPSSHHPPLPLNCSTLIPIFSSSLLLNPFIILITLPPCIFPSFTPLYTSLTYIPPLVFLRFMDVLVAHSFLLSFFLSSILSLLF